MAPDSPPHLDLQLALQQTPPPVPYLLDEIELLHLHNRFFCFLFFNFNFSLILIHAQFAIPQIAEVT